jgi:hypothetical protein
MKPKPESANQPNLANTRAPYPSGPGSVPGRLDAPNSGFGREPFDAEPLDPPFQKDPITLEEARPKRFV